MLPFGSCQAPIDGLQAPIDGLPENEPGKRGRLRKYGKNRIRLIELAECPDGRQKICNSCRGVRAERHCHTFLATSHFVGGMKRGKVQDQLLLFFPNGPWPKL